MQRFGISFGFVCVFILIISLSYIVPVFGGPSISGLFNVTPDSIVLNWTNNQANITLVANQSENGSAFSITLGIYNATGITSNYSQVDQYLSDYPACFQDNQYVPLLVINASNTSIYTNTTTLENGTSENFTLNLNVSCPPGRYYGYIQIANISNTSDHVNITVTINVLINRNNELNLTTGIGTFKGTMPANASGYHSYYFNVSEIYNARGVTINLTWNDSSKDMDIFLFNSSVLAGESVNKESSNELLNYSYLTPGIWEIRIYGNFTAAENYTGKLYFTTLNLTNSTDNATIFDINFGTMNVSDSKEVNLTLKNDGNLTSLSTREAIEIFHLSRSNSNTSNNYTFIVPSYATKVEASINWTGGANYTLSLFLPNGSLVSNSTDKRINANLTGAMQKEFVETSDIVKGVWRVEITNNTNVTGNYTIDLKFWVNASNWLSSNYTTTNFNKTGLDNYTKSFSVNMTVPNTSLSGVYIGMLSYKDSKGAVLSTQFRVNITTATLLVNNTLESDTVQVVDNIGFNRSGSSLQLVLPVNNTGNANLASINCTSSANLTNGAYSINFSYSCPSSLDAGSGGQLKINFTINTNETGNREGVYAGWIYLNATDAYPYQGFNLSVQVNLTDNLLVNVTQIKTEDGNNVMENITRAENITLLTNVSYINNTKITDLVLDNFTIWLIEGNVTSYRVPTSGSLNKWNGTIPLYNNSLYNINVTVPANLPGGKYYTYVNVNYSKNNISFSGSGSGYSFVINNTGLNMTAVSSTNPTLAEGNSLNFNITVTNFGILPANGNLTLSACNNLSVVASNRGGGDGNCGSQGASHFYNINISENGTETCWYLWTLTAGNVSTDVNCTFSISATDSAYENISGRVLITNSVTLGDGTGGTGACNSNASCASSQYCDLATNTCRDISCPYGAIINHICITDSVSITEYADYLSSVPGGSNFTSIRVNNTGQRAIVVKLEIDIDTGINASVAPDSCTLGLNASCIFNVTFDVSNVSSLGNHSGKFIAYESGAKPHVNDMKSFNYEVLTTAERIREINTSYYSLLNIFNNLSSEFKLIASYGVIPAENLTGIEGLLNESSDILAAALNAMNNRNYPLAESLLTELADKLNDTLTGLERIKSDFKEELERVVAWFGNIWIWVGIGIAIIVIGLLVYLLLPPPSGYHPDHGFRPKRDRKEGLKKIVQILRKKIKRKKKTKKPWQR